MTELENENHAATQKRERHFAELDSTVFKFLSQLLHALFARSYRLRSGWTDDAWTLALIPRTTYFGWTYQSELPLRPIWPGFAINTIFYAAILWLLTLGPFNARRFIRRKRGLCINCGYDLRGAEHEVCPECGAAT